MDFDKQAMGHRLKVCRVRADCKQSEAAKGIERGDGTVSAHELGVAQPSASQLYWYCKRYDVSADYILGLTEDLVSYRREKAAPDAEQPTGPELPITEELPKTRSELESIVADLIRRTLARGVRD